MNNKSEQAPVWHAGRITENDLTASVFRVLDFVPRAKEKFFEKLKRINKGREVPEIGKDPEVSFKPWPTWDIVGEDLIEFIGRINKGKKKHTVTPDAQIAGANWVIIVESEWKNVREPYEPKQLIEQFLAVESNRDEARGKYYLVINNSWSRPGPDFKKDVDTVINKYGPIPKEYEAGLKRLPGKLLWFNWQRFGAIFEDLLEEQYDRSAAWYLLKECISLLRKKGIVNLKPFEIERTLSKRRLRGLLDRLAVRINIRPYLFSAKNRLIKLNNALKSRPIRALEVLSDRKKALINLSKSLTHREANGCGIESALSKRRLRDLLDSLAVRIDIKPYLFPAKNRLIKLNNALKSRPINALRVLSNRNQALINLSTSLTHREANSNG